MKSDEQLSSNTALWKKLLTPCLVVFILFSWSVGLFKKFDLVLWDNFLSAQKTFFFDDQRNDQNKNSNDIIIVEIDSTSISQLENWPWRRSIYSNLLDKIATGNPDSIFIDIDFSSSSNHPEDDAMLEATLNTIAKKTPVYLPIFLQSSTATSQTLSVRQPIFSANENIGYVSVNMRPARDGLVREVSNGFRWNDQFYPSAWNQLADNDTPTTFIDYTLSTRDFTYFSVSEILEGKVDNDQFKDKKILIGATAIELGDIMPAPVVRAVPGVVLHALAVQTLENGGLFKPTLVFSLLLFSLVAFIGSLIFQRVHWAKGIVIGFSISLLLLPIYALLYHRAHLMLPIFPVIFVLVVVYFSNILIQLDENIIQKFILQLALNQRNKFLDSIFSVSNECILCINDKNIIISANPRSETLFHCDHQRLVGKSINQFLTDSTINLHALKDKTFDTTLTNIQGKSVPVEICVSPLDPENETTLTLAIRSLEEREEKEAALKFAAEHDKITGIFNRQKLFDIFEKQSPHSELCYLIRVDIEYFNEIIANYGHAKADSVLQTTIERIESIIEEDTILSRIGKNELAILSFNTPEQVLLKEANTLSATLNHAITIDNTVIEVFCHLGIAHASEPNTSLETLLKQANLALQAARQKGLNFDRYISRDEPDALDRLSILGAIRQTLRRSEFNLAFQPKYDLNTSEFVSCEVLLRTPTHWNKPINIGTLIETAEKSSLISPLTLWVVSKVISLETEWKTHQLPNKIAINLSVGLLSNDSFLDELISRIQSGNNFFELTFEVTETYSSDNWKHTLESISRLRRHGIHISVDDYGTGNSSLSYLKDLQARELKIDREFISDIDSDAEKQLIVSSTIKMAHELNMTVVAEGIETETENEYLRSIDCDQGQGYWYAKPMDFEALKEFQTTQQESLLHSPTKSLDDLTSGSHSSAS